MNSLRLGTSIACLFVGLGLPWTAQGQGGNDLPTLGDASSSLISPDMERRIGEDFLKQVRAALPTVDDPILKYYVEKQVADLAQYSELREAVLKAILIDNEQINAFAAPGGVIGINLGLMLHAQDVHEYASVIGHELAHLSQRHFARGVEAQRAQTPLALAAMVAAIMVGAIGGGDAGMAAVSGVQAATQANQLRYSRGREQEADRVGLNTVVRAGLDPQGMVRMFERMHRAYRHTRKPPEFLLTHPLSETRIADVRSQAQQHGRKRYPRSLDYQMMRNRARLHFADSPESMVKVFEGELREQPDDLGIQYGLALALSAAGEDVEAIALLDRILVSNPRNILYSASLAEVLIDAEKTEQAIALAERELAINPDNAPLAMLHAEALIAQGRHREAEAVLERQSVVHRDDVDVWYNLAEVSGLAGNIIGVHLARAQFFYLHAAYQRALQHLEYARRLTSQEDEAAVARLEQRIADLRTKLREQRS